MIDALIHWLRRGRSRRETGQRGCRACGRCCELFGGHLRASRSDLERWQRLGRADLLGRVNRLGWIWIDPQTGRQSEQCPFLQPTGPQTAGCTIHEIKPDMCRAYPTLAHSRRCVRGVSFPDLRLPAVGWALFDAVGNVSLVQSMFGVMEAVA